MSAKPRTMLDRAKLIDAVRDDEHLSASAKLVCIVIVSRSNREGSAWPSWRRLQRDTHLAKNTIRRAIAELEARGWLLVERRSGIDGQPDAANIYWPLRMGSMTDPPQGSTADHGKGHQKGHLAGSLTDPGGSLTEPPGGSTADPKPSHSEPTKKTNQDLSAVVFDFREPEQAVGETRQKLHRKGAL